MLNDLDERKRMMNIRKFDINDVIKNTANTFEVICSKKNIDLELLLSGRELFVEADMEQIQQVLYNLLDNAIKFSNDNSSILHRNENLIIFYGCFNVDRGIVITEY